MKLKTFLFDDESGVSPVIGVILMVAITVILAAVIATFVLGLGEQISDTAPSASFSYEYDDAGNGNVTITHTGGQTISEGSVSVDYNGTSESWSTPISAGNATTVGPVSQGDTVQVIWSSPEGDQTAILSEW